MTQEQHTPGPWRFKTLSYGWSLIGSNGRKVKIDPSTLDGALVESASDLLKALEGVRDALKNNPDIRVQSRTIPAEVELMAMTGAVDAAIAKAYGENQNA